MTQIPLNEILLNGTLKLTQHCILQILLHWGLCDGPQKSVLHLSSMLFVPEKAFPGYSCLF